MNTLPPSHRVHTVLHRQGCHRNGLCLLMKKNPSVAEAQGAGFFQQMTPAFFCLFLGNKRCSMAMGFCRFDAVADTGRIQPGVG